MGKEVIQMADDAQLDQLLTALRSSRTRKVISILAAREAPMPLADLASDIAVIEGDDDGIDPSDDLVHRIYVSLHHNHVPKLAAIGVVAYDADRTTVSLDDTSEHTDQVLKLLSQL